MKNIIQKTLEKRIEKFNFGTSKKPKYVDIAQFNKSASLQAKYAKKQAALEKTYAKTPSARGQIKNKLASVYVQEKAKDGIYLKSDDKELLKKIGIDEQEIKTKIQNFVFDEIVNDIHWIAKPVLYTYLLQRRDKIKTILLTDDVSGGGQREVSEAVLRSEFQNLKKYTGIAAESETETFTDTEILYVRIFPMVYNKFTKSFEEK